MIPRINKILYATDLSKNSNYAFFYAVDMAKRNNARIVILHSIERVRHIYSEGASGRVEEMLERAKKQEREVEAWVKKLRGEK
jgi:nucleotide-binding universal stress UspA family protein